MGDISRTALFGKLNNLGYKALEGSTVFAKLRGNPYVELTHWLHQIVQNQDSDLHRIVRRFEINPSKLAADMQTALDRMARGSDGIRDISMTLQDSVEKGWLYASLQFREFQVRTGHVIYACRKTPELEKALFAVSREFEKFNADVFAKDYLKIVGESPEHGMSASDGTGVGAGAGGGPGEASGAMAPAVMGKQEALEKYTKDLTEAARKGEIDPIVGRDDEIRQCVDILMRRRQNNPILVGEPGVGKTAVVEGFAGRIARGDVPPALKDVSVRELRMSDLQAGASMKGEFENRLKQVIEEVQQSPKPIILFIDEAHTLIGAGGAAGQNDAANLLKPALARGTLRTIAATTWAEYKKYFEKDAALTRRFQTVKVDEPDEKKAILMMRGVTGMFEKHHRVHILDEALESAVKLSYRYIPARQLPDKSVSLIDTAAARVAVSQHAVPAELDDCIKRIESLEVEQSIIEKEAVIGLEHGERKAEIDAELVKERQRRADLDERWKKEKALVQSIIAAQKKLKGEDALQAAGQLAPGAEKAAPLTDAERATLVAELAKLKGELTTLQGESPLILPNVDAQAIAAVVADWTGVPVGKMVKDEMQSVMKLADTLSERVIGQRHGLETIANTIRLSRTGLNNPTRPIGVFMLVGTSGVGKTETALALADTLYGGEDNLITINMSEFQEAHTVSTLKGAPPGYVGYGEGGVLTEAVRRRPYSVVLLDEVEKAHPDVHEIFFQVFDKGIMEDGEGRVIDFKNTIILLTSNAGSDLLMSMCKDPTLMPSVEGLQKAMREPLLKVFPAALLGRLVVVPYYPISDEMLTAIIKLQLRKIQKRVATNHKAELTYSDEVVRLVAERCTEVESGARAVDAILTQKMLPEMSREFLNRMIEGRAISKVRIGVKDSEFVYSFD
ncbi:MAG: type VI secretion system ATPase TssH [Tepidisphaera sp.]|jgi:type VI secretion system protein VasG